MNNNDGIKILLTIYSRGRIVSSIPSKVVKKYIGGKLLISQNEYKEPTYGVCVKRIKLTDKQVESMTSSECIPFRFTLSKKSSTYWENMSNKERLNWHISTITEGNSFDMKIND